ncbi:MAG: phosphoribosyltransferase family protein [Candidatus Competibacteraceae bacterium]
MRFKDRSEAGKQLAVALEKYCAQPAVVYGLPRGGVVLAVEIAQALHLPLDLIIPRKIGHPYNPEYAIGAVSEDGEPVYNEWEIARVDRHWLENQVDSERREARRRREQYLQGRKPLAVTGKTAILVDDGIATGLTMLAAIRDIKKRRPSRIVVAIPVAPEDTVERLLQQADEVVGLDITPHYLGAVGAYYDHFSQVSDAEVIRLMQQAS